MKTRAATRVSRAHRREVRGRALAGRDQLPARRQAVCRLGLGLTVTGAPPPRRARPAGAPGCRDETCLLSTGGGTRRVRLVRWGGRDVPGRYGGKGCGGHERLRPRPALQPRRSPVSAPRAPARSPVPASFAFYSRRAARACRPRFPGGQWGHLASRVQHRKDLKGAGSARRGARGVAGGARCGERVRRGNVARGTRRVRLVRGEGRGVSD